MLRLPLQDTLTAPSVVSMQVLDRSWSVKKVLDDLANADPPFNALIDTGALITGMDNFQVLNPWHPPSLGRTALTEWITQHCLGGGAGGNISDGARAEGI